MTELNICWWEKPTMTKYFDFPSRCLCESKMMDSQRAENAFSGTLWETLGLITKRSAKMIPHSKRQNRG